MLNVFLTLLQPFASMSQHPPDPLLVLNHFKLSVLFMLFHAFGLCTGFPLTYITFPFSLLILLLSSHEPFWRRQWQPTPVLLPGKSHGQRSLVGLQSPGSLRVRQDWETSLSLFTFMHCRRKWQPTPVFLPGESQGRGSLVGCCLWGCTELDTTEAT